MDRDTQIRLMIRIPPVGTNVRKIPMRCGVVRHGVGWIGLGFVASRGGFVVVWPFPRFDIGFPGFFLRLDVVLGGGLGVGLGVGFDAPPAFAFIIVGIIVIVILVV